MNCRGFPLDILKLFRKQKETSASHSIEIHPFSILIVDSQNILKGNFVVPVLIPAQPMYVYLLFFLSDLIYMPIF